MKIRRTVFEAQSKVMHLRLKDYNPTIIPSQLKYLNITEIEIDK